MVSTDRGARGESRSSALWGTGNRGGESRSSALWGSGNRRGERRANALWGGGGGRNFTLAAVAVLMLALPIGAGASNGKGNTSAAKAKSAGFVEPFLAQLAAKAPNAEVRVIVRSTKGHGAARKALEQFGYGKRELKELKSVEGLALALPASAFASLANVDGIQVTYDAPTGGSSFSNKQLWPHESGNAQLWAHDAKLVGKLPAIAVVDSGIQPGRLDFGARVLADVKLSSLADEPGDSRGHGTFVAGIAAGAAVGYAGAAPTAPIVSVDVMNKQGMAMVSDVIRACDWILANKATYNIRVANFSMHAARPSSIRWDPLNHAVEKLWFNGVVVVAAAGNYGVAGGPSGVRHAPGNDPFIITAGALDTGKSAAIKDDSVAYWSAYGYTYDGFAKPDVVASGRYMVGPVPADSTLAKERADKVVAPGYMELSGTSFAAPVVAGTVAQILARNPSWTPDQVKGALMLTARPVPKASNPLESGVGQITATKAVQVTSPPNPNAALNAYVVTTSDGSKVFDAAAWADAAWADAAWASAAWSSAAWSSAAWSSAAWADAAWASAAWNTAAWADAAWASAAWADNAFEDNAAVDPTDDEYLLTPEEELVIKADPDLAYAESTTTSTTSTTTSTLGGITP